MIQELKTAEPDNRTRILKKLKELDIKAYLTFSGQNVVSGPCTVSEGMARDLELRVLLSEDNDALYATIINDITAHDFNLIIVSWLGMPGIIAGAESKKALAGFETFLLDGASGAGAINDEQLKIASKINNDPSKRHTAWGVYNEDHIISNLDRKISAAVYVVELRPYLRSDLSRIRDLLENYCSPGSELVFVVSAQDESIGNDDKSSLRQHIIDKEDTQAIGIIRNYLSST